GHGLLEVGEGGLALRDPLLLLLQVPGIHELLDGLADPGDRVGPELFLDDRLALLGEFLELAEGGERGQILELEELEELAGGPVEEGPAHLVLLPQDLDELPLQEGLDHRAT